MAIEIERKFLVINDSWRDYVISKSHIRQGYLVTAENVTIRIRIAKGKALLNLKSKTVGIRRSEFEYEIPIDDAETMLESIAQKPIIEKVRHLVRSNDHVWEVDEFHGENEGLIIAELELTDENESFEHPAWAGDEVSSDNRYYNASLIKHPYRLWRDT